MQLPLIATATTVAQAGVEPWPVRSVNHSLAPNSKTTDCRSGNVADRTAARSFHRGGVNVLYVDGHFQFVKDSLNTEPWRAISTRSGDEVVSADAL